MHFEGGIFFEIMATIYQRLQEFYLKNPNFKFGKRRRKLIANLVKLHYDSKGDKLPPVRFVESIEETGTYTVRDYPTSHTPRIDKTILKIYNRIQNNISEHSPKKKRKRISKPVYSSRKTDLSNG